MYQCEAMNWQHENQIVCVSFNPATILLIGSGVLMLATILFKFISTFTVSVSRSDHMLYSDF